MPSPRPVSFPARPIRPPVAPIMPMRRVPRPPPPSSASTSAIAASAPGIAWESAPTSSSGPSLAKKARIRATALRAVSASRPVAPATRLINSSMISRSGIHVRLVAVLAAKSKQSWTGAARLLSIARSNLHLPDPLCAAFSAGRHDDPCAKHAPAERAKDARHFRRSHSVRALLRDRAGLLGTRADSTAGETAGSSYEPAQDRPWRPYPDFARCDAWYGRPLDHGERGDDARHADAVHLARARHPRVGRARPEGGAHCCLCRSRRT